MARLVLSERTKDRVLNILLVGSVLLFIFGLIHTKQTKPSNEPEATRYSVKSFAPLSAPDLPQYTFLQKADAPDKPVVVDESVARTYQADVASLELSRTSSDNSQKPSQATGMTDRSEAQPLPLPMQLVNNLLKNTLQLPRANLF